MKEKILIIGSNSETTSQVYKNLNLSPSQLITDLTQEYDVGHTSIQDIVDYDVLEKLLSSATKIYWAHSPETEFGDFDDYIDFLNWLRDYQHANKNVVNFHEIKFDYYNWRDTIPELTDDDMVFFGCSITAGVGLSNPSTRYSTQLATHFNKNCVNLAQGGGSNDWIFNKFAQTKFVPGQLVVVQLTSLARIKYVDESSNLINIRFRDGAAHRTAPNKFKSIVDVHNEKFLFHKLLFQITSMIEIARSKKLRMVFWLWNYKEGEYSKVNQTYFYDMPEFVPASALENYEVDMAEDNVHYGIKSNQNIALALIKHIEQIYECRH